MELSLKSQRVWLYEESVDFRKSIHGLGTLVMESFEFDWQKDIFIFVNRSRNKLKLLAWHGNGFILLYKSLERGKFKLSGESSKKSLVDLNSKQLSWLLAGLDWHEMTRWKSLTYDKFF